MLRAALRAGWDQVYPSTPAGKLVSVLLSKSQKAVSLQQAVPPQVGNWKAVGRSRTAQFRQHNIEMSPAVATKYVKSVTMVV